MRRWLLGWWRIDVAVCMKVVTKDRTKEEECDDLPMLAEFGDWLNWQGDRGFHSASLLRIRAGAIKQIQIIPQSEAWHNL